MNYWFLPIIGFYIASSAGYGGYLVVQTEGYHRAAYGLMVAGFALHTLLVITECALAGSIAVRNLHETLSFAAWALAAVFLALRFRTRLKILGLLAAPFITLMTVAAFFIPDTAVHSKTSFANMWVIAHVVVIFIGEAALALACATGILYLIQERSIKNKKHRFFFRRLPSLELLDSTGYAFIVTGFTALTVGLITGFVYAQATWGHFWSWDPKEVWSGITWLIYAALLHERLVAGWRGRRAAIFAIIGFVALLFTFLGVNLLLEGHHNEFARW
mgnify:CR=1 FL=1